MGKKVKRPNAPEMQQIFLSQQPSHNPYYDDIGTQMPPPPPYTDQSSRGNRPIAPALVLPRQSSSVIIQQPITFDRRIEKFHHKVKTFNSEMILVAILAIGLSIYANSLYSMRPCINFLVHQPTKDIAIKVYDVRDMQLYTTYASLFILVLCLAKCSTGQSKSYSCYLTLMGLTTFVVTLFTGYLAYLAFYTPCALNTEELASNTFKTIVGIFDSKLPSPDKGLFHESNVFQLASEDKPGVMTFCIDMVIFILYLSGFITAASLS